MDPLPSCPRLKAYIEEVRDIVRNASSDAQIVERVQVAAKDLVLGPLDMHPDYLRVPEDGYGRNLIYRDREHGFVVIAMAWPPGIQGAPHDHGTWGVVAVAEGEVVLENYERVDDGSDPEEISLKARDCVEGAVGDVGFVLPPEVDFHTVGNRLQDGRSLTIHTYGIDIRECNLVCPETGKLKRVYPSYL